MHLGKEHLLVSLDRQSLHAIKEAQRLLDTAHLELSFGYVDTGEGHVGELLVIDESPEACFHLLRSARQIAEPRCCPTTDNSSHAKRRGKVGGSSQLRQRFGARMRLAHVPCHHRKETTEPETNALAVRMLEYYAKLNCFFGYPRRAI